MIRRKYGSWSVFNSPHWEIKKEVEKSINKRGSVSSHRYELDPIEVGQAHIEYIRRFSGNGHS